MGEYTPKFKYISKYDCFVTFDASFVDIGYEISTGTYPSQGVKFKYSDMGYPSFADVAFAFRSVPCFNEFCKFWKRS